MICLSPTALGAATDDEPGTEPIARRRDWPNETRLACAVDIDTSCEASVEQVPVVIVYRALERFRCRLCERLAAFIVIYTDAATGETREPAACRAHVGIVVSAHL